MPMALVAGAPAPCLAAMRTHRTRPACVRAQAAGGVLPRAGRAVRRGGGAGRPVRRGGGACAAASVQTSSAAAPASGEAHSPDVEEGELGTVISGDKAANFLAPPGGLSAARGVVLFLHGFAQGPNAYYKLLRQVADEGVLVVAPLPPTLPSQQAQQDEIVEFAAHFRGKLFTNTLTGLQLPSSSVATNTLLLGHSVGAGLMAAVAGEAVAAAQPFKGAMLMAPQTQVVDSFRPSAVLAAWPSDARGSLDWALQYGLRDDLAPPRLSEELIRELHDGGFRLDAGDVTVFDRGTHVGFQDQVVLGSTEIVTDVLPFLNPALLSVLSALGVPFIPWMLAAILQRILESKITESPDDDNATAAAGTLLATQDQGASSTVARLSKTPGVNPGDLLFLESALAATARQAPSKARAARERLLTAWRERADGIGEPEKVSVPSAELSISRYVGLLLVVATAGIGLASLALSKEHGGWLPGLGALVAAAMCGIGGYNLFLQTYVMNKQRPESRAKAAAFVKRVLLK